jgi:hypothetical protein
MDHCAILRYVHLPNKDGSVDSMCSVCFATVASVRDEAELAQYERTHVCNPFWSHLAGKHLVGKTTTLHDTKPSEARLRCVSIPCCD